MYHKYRRFSLLLRRMKKSQRFLSPFKYNEIGKYMCEWNQPRDHNFPPSSSISIVRTKLSNDQFNS